NMNFGFFDNEFITPAVCPTEPPAIKLKLK
ncbi:unnamed protein product, partial [marine sediment metagenome]